MDLGHYNCRDYTIAPQFAPVSMVTERPSLHRDESYEELMKRSRSPVSLQPKFPLLRLPLELRQQVLSHLLPRTTELVQATVRPRIDNSRQSPVSLPQQKLRSSVRSKNVNNVVWLRGNTSIMAVCSQLHQECAELIYGTNTFLLFLTYKGVNFRFRWLMPHGIAPSRNYPFLELMPERYLRLIRKITVHVDHVDSYTGMIKFNVGGRGLIHGLRRQVIRLVLALQPHSSGQHRKQLSRVIVRVSTANAVLDSLNLRAKRDLTHVPSERELMQKKLQARDIQDILEPFGDLIGVRETQISGAVADDYADILEARMRSNEPRLFHSSYADEHKQDEELPPLCVYGNDMT